MARIRTIKPDFWTDEKVTECSITARLFFIGTWNFADDNGNLVRSAKKLKMQIFPDDKLDCEALVLELIDHGLLTEYVVSGKRYLHIVGFNKHQVINRPSKTALPQPDPSLFTEHSVSPPDELTDGREKEGKGKGKGKNSPVGESPAGDARPQKTGKALAPDEMDDKALVFSIGVSALTRWGVDDRSARGLIGRALKKITEEAALSVVSKFAAMEKVHNPSGLFMTLVEEQADEVLQWLRSQYGDAVRKVDNGCYSDGNRRWQPDGSGGVAL